MADKKIEIHITFSTSYNQKHKAFGSFKFSDPVKYYYYKNSDNFRINNEYLKSYLKCTSCNDDHINMTESIPNLIQNFIDLGDDPSFLGYYLSGHLSWGVCDTKSRNLISLDFDKNNDKDVYLIFISIKSELSGKSLVHSYYYCGYAKILKTISHINLYDSSFKYHSNKLLNYIENCNNYHFNEWSHDVKEFYNNKVNFFGKKIKFSDTIHDDWMSRAGITIKDEGRISNINGILQITHNCKYLKNYIIFDRSNTNILTNPIDLSKDNNACFNLLSHLCQNMTRKSCCYLIHSQNNNDLIKTFKGQGKGGMHTRHKLKFKDEITANHWLKELHTQIHGPNNENNLLPLAGDGI